MPLILRRSTDWRYRSRAIEFPATSIKQAAQPLPLLRDVRVVVVQPLGKNLCKTAPVGKIRSALIDGRLHHLEEPMVSILRHCDCPNRTRLGLLTCVARYVVGNLTIGQ